MNTLHEFTLSTNAWTAKSNLPYKVHRHCTVVDEKDKMIWLVGGHTSNYGNRKEVYYYTPNNDTWTKHSDMNSASVDPSCSILERANGSRWLLVVKGHQGSAVIRFDMTLGYGWLHISNLWSNQAKYYGKIVTLNPYSPLLLGSHTQKHGNSIRNFWEFNFNNNIFEDGYYFLQNEMHNGYWTTVNRGTMFRNLQPCLGFPTYAAVGWGGRTTSGSDYRTTVSVMLRQRKSSGQQKKPVSCHSKIPSLSPGKMNHGMTAIGYVLYVCGGYRYGHTYDANCHELDTNAESPSWSSMAAMPVARGFFQFVTYAGAAFAIAGYNGAVINRVDRYTPERGWVQVANTPLVNHRHCAVADEGYNNIYMLGGHNGGSVLSNTYRYQVNNDNWYGFTSLAWVVHNGACTTMYRKGDGHRLMVLYGNNEHRSQYYDLTTNSGWHGWTGAIHHQYQTRIVSLSPTESYEVGTFLFAINFIYIIHYASSLVQKR